VDAFLSFNTFDLLVIAFLYLLITSSSSGVNFLAYAFPPIIFSASLSDTTISFGSSSVESSSSSGL